MKLLIESLFRDFECFFASFVKKSKILLKVRGFVDLIRNDIRLRIRGASGWLKIFEIYRHSVTGVRYSAKIDAMKCKLRS